MRKAHSSRVVVRVVAAVARVRAVLEYDSGSVDILFSAPDTEVAVGAGLEAQLECRADGEKPDRTSQ